LDKHILEIDSIRKQYDNKPIVTDVYLKCETGNVIGLLGRNGSGKSTLLKIVFGIIVAEYKFIRIDGIIKNKRSQLLHDISYLPQENFIPNTFSVKKAIFLTIQKQNQIVFYDDEMIQSLKNKKIQELSGGELRYLEIKLILCSPAKFVLLDEPYSGLSPILISKVNTLIQEKSLEKGIIMTDHNYENVINVSSQLVLMKDGKTYNLKDKQELIDKDYLKEGMV